MGHKQVGAGKFIEWSKHFRNNRGSHNKRLRFRIREALKTAGAEYMTALRHGEKKGNE